MPRCSLMPAVLLMPAALGPACRSPAETVLTTERVASGLSLPLYVTAPPGDTRRLFIVEQRSGTTGRIRILDLRTGALKPAPFFSIPGVTTGFEQGLLGLAFHPDYADNGLFYVNYTTTGGGPAGQTVVARYAVSADPDLADPASAQVVLTIPQPYSNHNGGWVAFGPDGYLYIATGDGGDTGDPGDRAQDTTEQLLGKLLRIDVNGDDFPDDPARNYAIPPDNPFVGRPGDDEIWAYGLRNPWRNSFDRLTGDLYLADVGQNAWEEIDFQPAGSPGGANYGWRCYEGDAPFNPAGCPPAATMVFPIHVYGHGPGCSVTGGCVYRGRQICDLQGTYFFADFCSNQIWSFRYAGGAVTDFRDRTAELARPEYTINSISSFGEDAAGELYIVDRGGEVFRIVPVGPRKGDLNNDAAVDLADIDAFVLGLASPAQYEVLYAYPPAQAGDVDCSGALDFGDIDPFVALLSGG